MKSCGKIRLMIVTKFKRENKKKKKIYFNKTEEKSLKKWDDSLQLRHLCELCILLRNETTNRNETQKRSVSVGEIVSRYTTHTQPDC